MLGAFVVLCLFVTLMKCALFVMCLIVTLVLGAVSVVFVRYVSDVHSLCHV